MSNQLSRRTLAHGAAWSIPAVAIAGAAPAIAASRCGDATINQRGGLGYDWGVVPTNPKTTSTTTQKMTVSGMVELNNLPADAVITDIRYEYWIQQRDDSKTNANGSSGGHGPGIYDPGHSKSSIGGKNGTCKISYSTVSSCSYKWGSPVLTTVSGRTTSPIWTSTNATVGVTQAWVDHAFKKLDGTTQTLKAWQLIFQGDPAAATKLLMTDANGCKYLPQQVTSQFNVTYTNVLQAYASERALRIDRTAYVTYTSGGKSYTLSAYSPNTHHCNTSDSPGGVNIC